MRTLVFGNQMKIVKMYLLLNHGVKERVSMRDVSWYIAKSIHILYMIVVYHRQISFVGVNVLVLVSPIRWMSN